MNQIPQYNLFFLLSEFQEQAFLSKTVEELHLFREAIEEMRAHESQNKSSQFTAKFQEIEYEIDYLKNQIQNVVSKGHIISKS